VARAPFQVIVFPFLQTEDGLRYAIFHRRKHDMWQAVSGGGEDDETPEETAIRETREETAIAGEGGWIRLASRASIPVCGFRDVEHWPRDLYVIPEYAFGLPVDASVTLRLSPEHRDHAWLPFDEAYRRLTWDSNKVALWELDRRVRGLAPGESVDPRLRAASE
jgi:dATP pyrophosphohydrolase